MRKGCINEAFPNNGIVNIAVIDNGTDDKEEGCVRNMDSGRERLHRWIINIRI
jgi:hypothetical protein